LEQKSLRPKKDAQTIFTKPQEPQAASEPRAAAPVDMPYTAMTVGTT
jgi:hypothetical protein